MAHLSDRDVAELREVHAIVKQMRLNIPQRGGIRTPYLTPEALIVKVPDTTIPHMTQGFSSGSLGTPGQANCQVLSIIPSSNSPTLSQNGSQTVTVYNFSLMPIPPGIFLAKRTKQGVWIIEAPAVIGANLNANMYGEPTAYVTIPYTDPSLPPTQVTNRFGLYGLQSDPCLLTGDPWSTSSGTDFSMMILAVYQNVSSVTAETQWDAGSAGIQTLTRQITGMFTETVAPAWQTLVQGATCGVEGGSATTTTLTLNDDSIVWGQPTSMTIDVSPSDEGDHGTPTGQVALFAAGIFLGNANLSGGSATFNYSGCTRYITDGSFNITANYQGDSTYHSSQSSGSSLKVDKASVTLDFVVTPSTVTYGDWVTLNAIVNSDSPSAPSQGCTPTGWVTFKNGSTTIAVASLVGTVPPLGGGTGPLYSFAQLNINTLGAGSLTLTAEYDGDVNYEGGTATADLTINKKDLTIVCNNATREKGQGNPGFIANYFGLVLGQASYSVITGTPTFSCDADIDSDVGYYTITISVGSLASANYNFASFTNGTLAVTADT